MMRIIRRLWHLARRDSVALMGANLNYALIGVITGIVTARVLGVEGRGDLAVVVFWPTLIATLLELGVGDALTLWVAREVDNIRGNLWGVLLLTAAVSAIGVVAGLVLLPYVLRPEQHRLLSTAYLCLGLIPAYLLSLVPTGALLGLRRFHAVALVRIASTFAYLLTVIAVVVTHQGTVVSFMWLNVLARFFPLLIGFCLLVPALAGTKHGRLNVIGPLQDGAKLHASKLATVLSSSEDRAIANWMLSQAAIGQWQVASTLTFIIPFIAQGVSQHLYGSIPASSAEQRATITGAAYTRAVVFTAALALVVIPALPFAIPLVYGSDFAGAVMPSMIVVVAGVFFARPSVFQSSARG